MTSVDYTSVLTTVTRRILSASAQAWLARSGYPPQVWTAFPEWPAADAAPVWIAQEPPHYAHFPDPDPMLRALALDRLYDPPAGHPWAFVPGLGGPVWLVKTKALDSQRN